MVLVGLRPTTHGDGALSLMPRAGGTPVIPGLQIADLAGGLQAAFLVAAALSERSRTGRGTRVEVSMLDVMRDWTTLPRAALAAGLQGLGLTGEYPCYHVYPTADGAITVAALESKFWRTLCEALAREDLVGRQFDPSAIAELEAIFRTGSGSDWSGAAPRTRQPSSAASPPPRRRWPTRASTTMW